MATVPESIRTASEKENRVQHRGVEVAASDVRVATSWRGSTGPAVASELILNKKTKTSTLPHVDGTDEHDKVRRFFRKEHELDRNNVRNLIAEFRGREIAEQPLAEQKEQLHSPSVGTDETFSPRQRGRFLHLEVGSRAGSVGGPATTNEGDQMETKKPAAPPPPAPPPPIPSHLKASPLKLLNGDNCAVPLSAVQNGGNFKSRSFISSKTSSEALNGRSKVSVDETPILKLNGHVGFDSLPHQLVKKCTGKGFQFNLMCVGETGMGKTTLIESLFNMKLEFTPCNNELKTVELLSRTYDVVEGGIRLKLTIVETAGFGDQLDKDKSAQVIVDFINEQFERYLKEELKIKRCLDYYDDSRIHACLYFISPTGHGLKALDIATLQRLAERVNVIPVIAKADTTCKDELVRFKSKILSELKAHNISIYQFPIDDEAVRTINTELNQLIPYAVVGSTDFVKKENGKMVRARRYPWGMVEVENEEHCDFVKLREAVLRTNVDALRERTHNVLYEAYRRERLRAMKVGDGDTGPKMMEAFAQKQREFSEEMTQKEANMREEFVARVNKKEEEMKRREEMLNLRAKELSDSFEEELRRIDSQMHTLQEERMKLEAKAGKKMKK